MSAAIIACTHLERMLESWLVAYSHENNTGFSGWSHASTLMDPAEGGVLTVTALLSLIGRMCSQWRVRWGWLVTCAHTDGFCRSISCMFGVWGVCIKPRLLSAQVSVYFKPLVNSLSERINMNSLKPEATPKKLSNKRVKRKHSDLDEDTTHRASAPSDDVYK